MAQMIKEKRLVLGGLLVLIGLVLLADKFGFLFLPGWVFSWQMILIFIGVFALTTSGRPFPGVILLAIGGFFLLNTYFFPVFFQLIKFWPVAFIIAGLVVMFSLLGKRGDKSYRHKWRTSDYGVSSDDVLDEVAIFGGGNRKITSQNFRGGELVAIFGGSEIDLTQANLAEGVNVLEVVAIFGGWELRVPSGWNVEIKIIPIFGGFSDKRYVHASDPADNTRKLVITGTTIFGGGELKNYPKR